MNKLHIITSTVREGRRGPAMAHWIAEMAKQTGKFEVKVIDLGELNLPMMTEANHPVKQDYQFEHTKAWSKTVNEADAYIFVLAEYNFSVPAPLKNALDYLYYEWNDKPAGIVSYGGMSAGLRSSQMLKQIITTLKIMPMCDQVAISGHGKYIDENNKFNAADNHIKAAETMLESLDKWTEALKVLRK